MVRNKLAWMASNYDAARALVYSCAQMIEEGKEDTVREVSMLKAYACETLQEVVHGCLQLHGRHRWTSSARRSSAWRAMRAS